MCHRGDLLFFRLPEAVKRVCNMKICNSSSIRNLKNLNSEVSAKAFLLLISLIVESCSHALVAWCATNIGKPVPVIEVFFECSSP